MKIPATYETEIALTTDGVEIAQVVNYETARVYLSFEQATQIMEWLVTRAGLSWQEPNESET
jgi:hypothetical protein